MADPAIPATTPTILDATFPYWSFQIQSIGDGLLPFGAPLGSQPPIQFVAVGTKFRVRSDGVQERSPLASDTVTMTIPDLYAEAAIDPTIAAALGAMLAAVQAYGAAQGVL
jgi:hypothetical protein